MWLHAGEVVVHVVFRRGGHGDALGNGEGADAPQPDHDIGVGTAGQRHPVVNGLARGIRDDLVEHDVLDTLLFQDVLHLVDDLPLVEDGLGHKKGALAVFGHELADSVDGVQPEDDPRRDMEKDVRHGVLASRHAACRRRRWP